MADPQSPNGNGVGLPTNMQLLVQTIYWCIRLVQFVGSIYIYIYLYIYKALALILPMLLLFYLCASFKSDGPQKTESVISGHLFAFYYLVCSM